MKKSLRVVLSGLVVALFSLVLTSCNNSPSSSDNTSPPPASPESIHILSGSENELLVPILKDFSAKTGIPVDIQFKGSVDIMLALQQPDPGYDAVWPANSLWIDLSESKAVKHAASICRMPVVIGIKKSKAEALGLMGKALNVEDLVQLAKAKKLQFLMSNPTQSNSGAMAYLGFLHGIVGRDDAISMDDLDKSDVKAKAKELLAAVARTSGSSGWLEDLMVQNYDQFDAMVNYEAIIIEANQELQKEGKEPLIVFYPQGGQAIADSPLAFISRPGQGDKEEKFLKLQQYLLSTEVQKQLGQHGRRTGIIGTSAEDPNVFKSEWGIQTDKILQPTPLPAADVIRKALVLYQTMLKKPSLTVYVLDYSGSMYGLGQSQVQSAMKLLLSAQAEKYFLQPGDQDITFIIPFDAEPRDVSEVRGNAPDKLQGVLEDVMAQRANGGTNFYKAINVGLERIRGIPNHQDYQTSIILMTDGESEGSFDDAQKTWQDLGGNIPIFSVMFGEANPAQLTTIAKITKARVFDGRKDMVDAFKNAKGYN